MGSVLHSFKNHYQKSKTFYSRGTPGQWFAQVVSSKYGDKAEICLGSRILMLKNSSILDLQAHLK